MADQKEEMEEIKKLRSQAKEKEGSLNQAKAELSGEWKKSKWENRKQKQGKGPRDYDKIISSQQKQGEIKKELTSLYDQLYQRKQKLRT